MYMFLISSLHVPHLTDQRQEIFTGALSTFFLEFLKVDASVALPAAPAPALGPASPAASSKIATAPVTTPAAKSASKSRKSEKRKSDALQSV